MRLLGLSLAVLALDICGSSLSAAVYKDIAFTEFFRRTNGIVACDGAFSLPLSDGRVLWLFGDSYVDCYRDGTIPCLFQVRNCAMLHHKSDLQDVQSLTGKHAGIKSFFKNGPAEDPWFWPVSGFQHSNSVYVYLTTLKKKGTGNLGFATVGQDHLARMAFPQLEVTAYLRLPHFNGIDFGTGFIYEPKATHTYAYGQKRDGTTLNIFLARFPTDTPETNWVFWDGTDWSANPTNAAPVTRQRATSISVCKVRGKFLLTSSEFSVACDQGKEIYMSVSDKPTGPFTAQKRIFTIDDTYEGHYPFFYLPVAHPEFINVKDEILVTYCINNYEPCVAACSHGRANPDHYRPRAIRVPLNLVLD
jgi:hypothetical protein